MKLRLFALLLLVLGLAFSTYLSFRHFRPFSSAERQSAARTLSTLQVESSAGIDRLKEAGPAGLPAAVARPDTASPQGRAGPELSPEQSAKLEHLRMALQLLATRLREQSAQVQAAAATPAEAGVEPSPRPPTLFPLSQEGIKDAVREAKPMIKACYEAWLQANPQLAGRLLVSFKIVRDPDGPDGPDETGRGIVQEAKVKGEGLGNTFLDGCVVASLAGLHFEAPESGHLSVTYPFRFATHTAAPAEP